MNRFKHCHQGLDACANEAAGDVAGCIRAACCSSHVSLETQICVQATNRSGQLHTDTASCTAPPAVDSSNNASVCRHYVFAVSLDAACRGSSGSSSNAGSKQSVASPQGDCACQVVLISSRNQSESDCVSDFIISHAQGAMRKHKGCQCCPVCCALCWTPPTQRHQQRRRAHSVVQNSGEDVVSGPTLWCLQIC